MTSIEFGKLCREYNKQYRNLFGYVPCPDDYSATQDEFFDALKKSIELNVPIDTFLKSSANPVSNDIRI